MKAWKRNKQINGVYIVYEKVKIKYKPKERKY